MRFVIKPAGMLAVAAALSGLGYLAFGPVSGKDKSASASPDGAPVYLNNADFERVSAPVNASQTSKANISGKIAEGWADNSEWATLTLRYADESKNPHGGATCQRIEIGDIKEGQLQFVQTMALTPGALYQAKVWVRASKETGAEVALRQIGEPYKDFAMGRLRIGKEWKPIEVIGSVDEEKVNLMLRVMQSNITVWVDDATVEPVKKAAK
jgi:hypothetical protein